MEQRYSFFDRCRKNFLLLTVPLRLSWELTGKSFPRTLFLFTHFLYFALTRKLLSIRSTYKINCIYSGTPFSLFLEAPMDLMVLKEVYLDKEYEWCPIENPKVIIDLGAHFGETALYYYARFPDAKVVAVEPSSKNFARLEKHTDAIENIIAIKGAIGAKNGTAALNEMESSLGHSLLLRADSVDSYEVELITLDALFKRVGIEYADLIKFDIEGTEFALFENVNPERYADAYIGEIHFDMVEDWDKERLKNVFHAFHSNFLPISSGRYLATFENK